MKLTAYERHQQHLDRVLAKRQRVEMLELILHHYSNCPERAEHADYCRELKRRLTKTKNELKNMRGNSKHALG